MSGNTSNFVNLNHGVRFFSVIMSRRSDHESIPEKKATGRQDCQWGSYGTIERGIEGSIVEMAELAMSLFIF